MLAADPAAWRTRWFMAAEARVTRRDEVVPAAVATRAGETEIRAYQAANRVGEGPVWHPAQECLYWIDVRGRQLLRLHPPSGALIRWDLPEVVGAFALCTDDSACLAFPHRLVRLDMTSGVLSDIARVEDDRPANRLNDGKVSPSGRWFAFGSMDDRPDKDATGALYCLGLDGRVRKLCDGLVVCNGIAWSPDATKLYFSDSFAGTVFVAPWDEVSAVMGEPRVLVRLDERAGRPDGAAVDESGNYWSAGVSAACINVIGAGGSLLRKIALPCRAPTMPAFAGADRRTLFVTSLVRPQWETPGRWDGAVLGMSVDTAGIIPPLFRYLAM